MEIETAEECIESLSQAQASSKCSASQGSEQPDDESDVTTLDDETARLPRESENENPNLVEDSDHDEMSVRQVLTPPEVTRMEFLLFVVLSDRVDKQR